MLTVQRQAHLTWCFQRQGRREPCSVLKSAWKTRHRQRKRQRTTASATVAVHATQVGNHQYHIPASYQTERHMATSIVSKAERLTYLL